jgi:hypothetical protein
VCAEFIPINRCNQVLIACPARISCHEAGSKGSSKSTLVLLQAFIGKKVLKFNGVRNSSKYLDAAS